MLQPNRLKYKKIKITRVFSWKDVIEFFIVILISFLVSFLAFRPFALQYKWIVFAIMFFTLLILILPSGQNCKIYELLIRMFKFKSMPHKFAKVISNNKERDSADLNPYSSLVSSDVVKNKIFTNKLFSKTEHNNYFMVLQINGQDQNILI